MGISLTPELNRLVQEQLALGVYRSEEEVLRAALQALNVQQETLTAISEGYADVEAGRHRPFDEADAEFRKRHSLSPEP